ncbi:Peptidase C54 [Penicillium chermesinum]|uniref:Cysteine protease n=1 Tax=Penicillium chermesinum TaxID=63820 RepID=A0A9W9NGZ6_9EURO|nr:Peptidase C54 [Penicillium chermesinum]KAJ5219781.1 Peptidase C54 [Penicillium chermesinum]KAJ6153776.1 Peptidase C54 [Penicillium chermesinum]
MTGVDLEKCKRIVQYFWDPEPRNDAPEQPIWCLGQPFLPQVPQQNGSESEVNQGVPRPLNEPSEGSWPNAFLEDFESRIWMTYRSNFPPIPRTKSAEANSSMTLGVRLRSQLMDPQGFTSDTGWGCMIRSGQSLLANTLSILKLGRDWRRGSKPEEEAKLLKMFADHPDAQFSIHRFVQCGAYSCGKYPGEWFGPSATARCIQILTSECKEVDLNVYVTNDTSDVYEDQFRRIACSKKGQVQPTLILLGLRLGIDKITAVYWDGLRTALQYPQSVGIAGGRPSSSHYFVGVQDSQFFFLDPHLTRPALPYHSPDQEYAPEERGTYYTRRIRRLHIKDMDPSMLIGFLIRDETDWVDWKQRVRSSPGKPIIHILAGDAPVHQGLGREGAVDEVEALDDSDGLE